MAKSEKEDVSEFQLEISNTADGKVRVDFGRAIAWLSMSHDQALILAEALIKKAEEAKPKWMN